MLGKGDSDMSLSISSLLGTNDISSTYSDYSANSISGITNNYNSLISSVSDEENDGSFETVFQSALDLINETNEYTNAAEEEELNYAMGLSEDTHTLMIAQQKANLSLQYTVAVRDAVVDAYNQIMNMQF